MNTQTITLKLTLSEAELLRSSLDIAARECAWLFDRKEAIIRRWVVAMANGLAAKIEAVQER
jgi:hypothetical protein